MLLRIPHNAPGAGCGHGVTRHVTVGFSDPAVRSLPPERDQAAQRQRRREVRWLISKISCARKPPSVGGSPRLQPNWWSRKNCLRWPPVWRPWPSRTTRTWPEIGIGSGRARASRVQQSGMSLVNLQLTARGPQTGCARQVRSWGGYVGREVGDSELAVAAWLALPDNSFSSPAPAPAAAWRSRKSFWLFFALAGTPYHRTDPNHRSIVSAIAVQTTLVTTRNSKPKPNIASARYSVPTVPPTPTNKAHAIRPMRRMFNWKRRLARLQGGFGRDSIGGKHKLHLHNITSQQRRSATEPGHQGATYPVASDPWSRPTSCGATTDVGGPGQFRGLSFGEIGIPFRAPGRGFPARAELCLGLLQGGRADPAKITIRVMAITSLETRLP